MTRVVASLETGDRVLLAASLRTRDDVEAAARDSVAPGATLVGSGAPLVQTVLSADGRPIPYVAIRELEEVDG